MAASLFTIQIREAHKWVPQIKPGKEFVMNHVYRRGIVLVSVLAFLLTLEGCNKEGKFEGTYVNSKEKMTLVISADHKGSLTAYGKPGDVTWEMTADDKIIVHAGMPITMFYTAEGNLRDEEGTVWGRK
jgi:hypothetical protein